jgi:NTP pyrophosphatase (non-canonical NTP hydrolase)
MDQADVAALNDEHDMTLDPEHRLLDLQSEVGELAKELLTAQDYGDGEFTVTEDVVDEFGDAYYCLLALADELDVDAEAALGNSVEKYRTRLAESGDAGSGE